MRLKRIGRAAWRGARDDDGQRDLRRGSDKLGVERQARGRVEDNAGRLTGNARDTRRSWFNAVGKASALRVVSRAPDRDDAAALVAARSGRTRHRCDHRRRWTVSGLPAAALGLVLPEHRATAIETGRVAVDVAER